MVSSWGLMVAGLATAASAQWGRGGSSRWQSQKQQDNGGRGGQSQNQQHGPPSSQQQGPPQSQQSGQTQGQPQRQTQGQSGNSNSQWRGAGQSAGSPDYPWLFEYPLPIPPNASPIESTNVNGKQIDYYEITMEPFQKQIYPNLGSTEMVGYNGTGPGPTFWVQRGTETVIRYHNNQVRNCAVHLHGSYTHSPWDGWASDVVQPGQFKDYYYPNAQSARAIWYHDHADHVTGTNAYSGLGGIYIIYDPNEDYLGLPKDKYDIPLALSDKVYNADGSLNIPNSTETLNFFGDIIQVNEQPWPFFNVEPRKYRLRLFDMSLSRAYKVHVEDDGGNWVDFKVIAADSGLFSYPVDSNDVTIACGERYEIVIDFAQYSGQNLTMKNAMNNAGITEFANTDKVMKFVVGNSVSDSTNNGDVPGTLNPNVPYPEKKTEVDHTFNFELGRGEATWTVNGVSFNDVNNRVLARPAQGTVELWELRHTGGPGIHPVHVHLVDFQVVSRTGGSRGVLPYESAGLKDVVLLEPGETVQVLAYYGPWNGLYMFHCHNLIHEDNAMMVAFNVTALEGLGYEDLESLGDPMDPRFAAKPYSDDAYTHEAIQEDLQMLGGLNAYGRAAEIQSAVSAYYTTNPGATAGTTITSVSSPLSTAAPATTTDNPSRATGT